MMSNILNFLINEVMLKGYCITFENDENILVSRITISKNNKYYRQLIDYYDLLESNIAETILIDKIKYMIRCIEESNNKL